LFGLRWSQVLHTEFESQYIALLVVSLFAVKKRDRALWSVNLQARTSTVQLA